MSTTQMRHIKVRQAFSLAEDATLRCLVKQFGENNSWVTIAQYMPNRNARQCRDRWRGYLRPSLSIKAWSEDEDRILINKYSEFGARWTAIGKFLPNRSEVAIKTRYKILATYCSQNSSSDEGGNNSNCCEIYPLAVYFNNLREEKQTTENKHKKFEMLEVYPKTGPCFELEQLFNTLNLDSLPNGPVCAA
ncbi:Myb-like DNA-binding domain containing protein [Tritrichomonas foetus]|uniref:Myb-like DNA-binding domain containing protein n=1 Tax=Tritrichomonas foetus TaxID=1144522 RepID=A0A1J4KBV7_9EUKA|nr:Myb-like DNA-binding domain containing protein [Tritrichomonas foetus]|eukprot:OHT08408.1 Myb-like DNA-binding domain containing protein [Tritrichomonas foetus]